MEEIFADITCSISEFKKNPNAVLSKAKKPVAVLSHNKPSFYMVQPAIYEAMLEVIADAELEEKVFARMSERSKAIEVDIDKI